MEIWVCSCKARHTTEPRGSERVPTQWCHTCADYCTEERPCIRSEAAEAKVVIAKMAQASGFKCPECGWDGMQQVTRVVTPLWLWLHCNKCEHVWDWRWSDDQPKEETSE